MRFAYADPPYLGLAAKFYGDLHPEAAEYDRPEKHQELIDRLEAEYDGWALSLHVKSLRAILPMVPEDVRICAWVKPFASFKSGVKQAWCWEPVIVRPVRKPEGKATIPDYAVVNIAMQRGLRGAKPEGLAYWLFAFAGLRRDDEFDDVFSGTGGMMRAWHQWCGQMDMAL